jgi:hypothetical protein
MNLVIFGATGRIRMSSDTVQPQTSQPEDEAAVDPSTHN